MTNKNLIWLASYPKSGNTWFRSFLNALLNETDIDINELEEGKIFSRRNKFEETIDIDSSLLSDIEIKCLQPSVYSYLSEKNSEKQFYKIHDAFVKNKDNENIVPENETLAAIYFVRNPLDIVVSFANHNGSTIEKTIENMNNANFQLSYDSGMQLEQPLLTWSQHYRGWTTKPNFQVHVIRYEDMLSNTFNIFKDIIQKIGLTFTDEEIKIAINATSFEKLKKQEEEKGFREKNPNSPKFFNNGTSGTWKSKLTNTQIERIITEHGAVMRELGYL